MKEDGRGYLDRALDDTPKGIYTIDGGEGERKVMINLHNPGISVYDPEDKLLAGTAPYTLTDKDWNVFIGNINGTLIFSKEKVVLQLGKQQLETPRNINSLNIVIQRSDMDRLRTRYPLKSEQVLANITDAYFLLQQGVEAVLNSH